MGCGGGINRRCSGLMHELDLRKSFFDGQGAPSKKKEVGENQKRHGQSAYAKCENHERREPCMIGY